MIGNIVFVISIIGVVVCHVWIFPRIDEHMSLSQKLENQKYSYSVWITLSTGTVCEFRWHSNYLYESVTELLKKASKEEESGKIVIFYTGKEIVINKKQVVLIEMESQDNETKH